MTSSTSGLSFHLPPSGPLKVFVSSPMRGNEDLRAAVADALQQIRVEGFLYERNAGARPGSVVEVSLAEVERADLVVVLLSGRFGEVTACEFRHARKSGKPCLVYLRGSRATRRAKALKQFLDREVFPPASGVSPEFFDTVVDLAAKVGRDIMRLLVEAYRQGSRTLPVSAVAPVARLAWDVADWYQAQQVEQCKLTSEPAYRDERTMDLRLKVDRVSLGRRPVSEELLVRCVSGLVGLPEVERFLTELEASGADLGQIISDLGVTPGARERLEGHPQATVLTFDELLDETVRFEGYLDALEEKVRGNGIDTGYVTLGCTWEEKGPGEPGRLSRYAPEEGGVDRYVELWLLDSRKEHVSILGEFGTGKTWTVYHLAWKALQKYREKKQMGLPRPRLPLVISLRDFAKALSLEALVAEFFFVKHNIGLANYNVFLQLNRMGKLLLLFDGFDEMAARVDRQKMIHNFWELARVLVPGAKAVLTCRTEHFPDAREGRALLSAELQASTAALSGDTPQFEVVELEKLDLKQIREVLSRRTAGPRTVERVMGNAELVDLAQRPLMIELILEALPDVEKTGLVDLARVYLYAVRRKMERDIKEERTLTSFADKLYFLCELSWEMLATDRMSLNYRLFPDRLRRLFGEVVQEERDLDLWQWDMRGQTLLIRNADGDYSPAHRSLLEFFVAYKLVAELGVLAEDFMAMARQQSHVDESLAPRDYVWGEYFQRELDESGRVRRIAPLRAFATADLGDGGPGALRYGWRTDSDSLKNVPRNALLFAAGMVSNDPASLDKLCEIAWEETRTFAGQALDLLPFLKHQSPEMLAHRLIDRGQGHPLRSGVAWALGELGVATEVVIQALEQAAESFEAGRTVSAAAWWESAFALEKVGQFGPRKGRQGDEAVAFLINHLPAGVTLATALVGLRRSLHATDPKKAAIHQSDIVTIVKHENEIDRSRLFHNDLAAIDFSSDTTGRRCYYAAWLCGHLGIVESANHVVRATRHPQGSVRNCAAEALGKLGTATPEVIQALEAALKDSYYRTRFHAAWSLGELRAAVAAPKLAAAIALEEVRDVRQEMERVYSLLSSLLKSSRWS